MICHKLDTLLHPVLQCSISSNRPLRVRFFPCLEPTPIILEAHPWILTRSTSSPSKSSSPACRKANKASKQNPVTGSMVPSSKHGTVIPKILIGMMSLPFFTGISNSCKERENPMRMAMIVWWSTMGKIDVHYLPKVGQNTLSVMIRKDSCLMKIYPLISSLWL